MGDGENEGFVPFRVASFSCILQTEQLQLLENWIDTMESKPLPSNKNN
jgi:hypothetical protein